MQSEFEVVKWIIKRHEKLFPKCGRLSFERHWEEVEGRMRELEKILLGEGFKRSGSIDETLHGELSSKRRHGLYFGRASTVYSLNRGIVAEKIAFHWNRSASCEFKSKMRGCIVREVTFSDFSRGGSMIHPDAVGEFDIQLAVKRKGILAASVFLVSKYRVLWREDNVKFFPNSSKPPLWGFTRKDWLEPPIACVYLPTRRLHATSTKFLLDFLKACEQAKKSKKNEDDVIKQFEEINPWPLHNELTTAGFLRPRRKYTTP